MSSLRPNLDTYLVLKLCRIAPVDRYRRAIHMQLSDDTAAPLVPPHQLRPERAFVRTLAQSKEADEDISLRILVGQERLPTPICSVVPTEQFHGLRTDLVVYLVDLQDKLRKGCGSMRMPWGDGRWPRFTRIGVDVDERPQLVRRT